MTENKAAEQEVYLHTDTLNKYMYAHTKLRSSLLSAANVSILALLPKHSTCIYIKNLIVFLGRQITRLHIWQLSSSI